MGWSTRADQKRLPNAVNSSGAVSPLARATASSAAVVTPARAAGSTTRSVETQRGAPSANAAWRYDAGTSLTTSPGERTMVGNMSTASATPPANAENRPMGTTSRPNTATPTTMDGAPD